MSPKLEPKLSSKLSKSTIKSSTASLLSPKAWIQSMNSERKSSVGDNYKKKLYKPKNFVMGGIVRSSSTNPTSYNKKILQSKAPVYMSQSSFWMSKKKSKRSLLGLTYSTNCETLDSSYTLISPREASVRTAKYSSSKGTFSSSKTWDSHSLYSKSNSVFRPSRCKKKKSKLKKWLNTPGAYIDLKKGVSV